MLKAEGCTRCVLGWVESGEGWREEEVEEGPAEGGGRLYAAAGAR